MPIPMVLVVQLAAILSIKPASGPSLAELGTGREPH